MANPLAEVNFQAFLAFVQQHNEEGDWDDYTLPDKLDLNKKMIARECGFDRKRLTENSKIFSLYSEVKESLIEKGILLSDNRNATEKYESTRTIASNAADKRAMKKQQEVNAALQAELIEANKKLIETQKKLERLNALGAYMLATGRL